MADFYPACNSASLQFCFTCLVPSLIVWNFEFRGKSRRNNQRLILIIHIYFPTFQIDAEKPNYFLGGAVVETRSGSFRDFIFQGP